jgi:hypothetical protein
VLTGPLTVAQQLNLRLHRLFLVLVFSVAILNAFAPMLDNVDLGWHVAQGRWMVEHLAIYRADAFNYPNLGHPVIDEYPLFQLALYASTWAGWWGPCVLCAFGYCLLLSILVLTARSLGLRASSTFAVVLGLMFLYLHLAFPLRPHLVTYLGVAAFGSFLLRHREAANWMRFWPLALVQIAWTNSHSGFVIGPALVAIFGLEMILRRWRRSRVFPWTAVRTWSGAFVLVFLGCFVNPYGVLRFEPPFYQEHLEAIRAYVGEMQPLNAGGTALYNHITLLVAVLIGLASCGAARSRSVCSFWLWFSISRRWGSGRRGRFLASCFRLSCSAARPSRIPPSCDAGAPPGSAWARTSRCWSRWLLTS